MIITTLRILIIIVCLYSLTDASIPKQLAEHFSTQKGGRNQFLTIIGVQLTILTLLLNVLRCRRLHSFLYPIALTAEFTISITFWFFYFTNPACLMRPVPGVDVLLPFYMDLVYHLLPLAALVIEAFVIDLNNFSLSIWTLALVPVAYYIWAFYLFKSNGVWPYPMLDNLSETRRIAYFAFYALIGTVSSHVFIFFVRRMRGYHKERKEIEGKDKPENEASVANESVVKNN